jgi:tetratricopeptide (TPR) repeat protein
VRFNAAALDQLTKNAIEGTGARNDESLRMTDANDATPGAAYKTPAPAWDDAAVPLEMRGISRRWLLDFVGSNFKDINAPRAQAVQEAERARGHNEAGRWGRHDLPDLPIPEIPPFTFLTTHGLVNRMIKPLTASIKAPLYALVPDEFRGLPTTFVSHTWSSLLMGPQRQRVGTLDALEHCDHEFVWIDFACYNQHTFKPQTIPNDMLRVIEAIGSVSVCVTPTPIYTRCWCLWELLCAHRAETAVSLLVRRGYRNDKIMAVNALYRSFRGIEKADTSVAGDREMIRMECLSYFGSIARADAELERIIQERFSSSWHELQGKNEQMRFSPTPWIVGDSGAQPSAGEPYFEPGLLDCAVFDSDRTVGALFADAGVYLSSDDMGRFNTARTEAAASAFNRGVLLEESGDVAGAEAALRVAIDSSHPDYAPKAAFKLGVLLAKSGDATGAEAAYRVAIDFGHPDQAPEAAYCLGYLLADRGDVGGAEAAYQVAINSDDFFYAPTAAFGLGNLLAKRGDLAGAEAAYRVAMIEPGLPCAPMAAFNVGSLLAHRGDVGGAEAAYRVAINSGHPDHAPKAAVNLGILLAKSGDVGGAEAAYRAAIDSGHRDYAPMAERNLEVLRRAR